jgi:hypothetical protein
MAGLLQFQHVSIVEANLPAIKVTGVLEGRGISAKLRGLLMWWKGEGLILRARSGANSRINLVLTFDQFIRR